MNDKRFEGMDLYFVCDHQWNKKKKNINQIENDRNWIKRG